MGIIFALVFPLIPLAALWLIARHGPIRNPLWRGETAFGFALFIGSIAFLAGFVGPIVFQPEANQGPLLGIFITGPIGFLVGLLWGLVRAARRRVK